MSVDSMKVEKVKLSGQDKQPNYFSSGKKIMNSVVEEGLKRFNGMQTDAAGSSNGVTHMAFNG